MQLSRVLGAVLLCACVPAKADSFLVLPFFNLSGDSSIDWVGESLSETVREALASEGMIALDRDARLEAFRRLSVRPYTPLTKATVLRLAESVDAEQVVYGRFEFVPAGDGEPKTKGTLRIVAQVLNRQRATSGGEYTELGALEDLARLQTHLAWLTVRAANPDGAVSEGEFRRRRPAIRVEAIENHTRALLTANADQKLKLLNQAVRLDPRYSQAHFELGRLWFDKDNWRQAADWFKKVAAWDVRYREATFLLGLCQYNLDDYAAAEASFRAVSEAVPLNEVWNNLGAAQVRQEKGDALENFRKALEGDPGDPDYHFNVGLALFRAGQLDAAAESFRAVLDRDPGDAEALTMLGRALTRPSRRSTTPFIDPAARLKESFEESVWLQLKAVLEPKR